MEEPPFLMAVQCSVRCTQVAYSGERDRPFRASDAHAQLFRGLMQAHHYLGYSGPVGENLRYLAWDRHDRPLGGLLFGAAAWRAHLKALGITRDKQVRIATEAALIGSLIQHGFPPEVVMLSDDAGQFNVSPTAACWNWRNPTFRAGSCRGTTCWPIPSGWCWVRRW